MSEDEFNSGNQEVDGGRGGLAGEFLPGKQGMESPRFRDGAGLGNSDLIACRRLWNYPFRPRDLGLRGEKMIRKFRQLWCQEDGQDIAEYAVMLAVILVIVVGTVQLIGSNANNVFSSVASSLQ
jgi:Flp pilus assembly pilin Flp